jgi:hypothetical protein
MAGFLLPGDEYASWADCGIGSYVELESRTDMTVDGIGLSTLQRVRSTLLELRPEKAVVEVEVTASAQGRSFDLKNIREILAAPPPEPERSEVEVIADEPDEHASVEKRSFADMFPDRPWIEGDELLPFAGQFLPCRRRENSGLSGGLDIHVWMFTSERIPGGSARLEVRLGTSQVTTMVVTAFEKK